MNPNRNIVDEITIGEKEPTYEIEERPKPTDVISWGSPHPEAPEIFMSQRALQDIEDHAYSDPQNEVGGILVGNVYRCPEDHQLYIEIKGAIEAHFAENAPAQMVFTHESWQEIDRIAAASYPGQSYVGWYHTHPNWGVFLSTPDIFIHENYFREPWQVALVVDPIRNTFDFFFIPEQFYATCGGFYELQDEQQASVVPWQHNPSTQGNTPGVQAPNAMQLIESRGKYVRIAFKYVRRSFPHIIYYGFKLIDQVIRDDMERAERAEAKSTQLKDELIKLQQDRRQEQSESRRELKAKDKAVAEKLEAAQIKVWEISKQCEASDPSLSRLLANQALSIAPDSESAGTITTYLDRLENRIRVRLDELSEPAVVFEARRFADVSNFITVSGENQIAAFLLLKKEKAVLKYSRGESPQPSEEVFTCEDGEQLLAIALDNDETLHVLTKRDGNLQMINVETREPLRLDDANQIVDLKEPLAFMFAEDQIDVLTLNGLHRYVAQEAETETGITYQYQGQLIPESQRASLDIQDFTRDSYGNLYLARTTHNRVLKISSHSQEVITIGDEDVVFDGLKKPASVHYSDDSLYVLDIDGKGYKRILKFAIKEEYQVQFPIKAEFQHQIVFDPAWSSNDIKQIRVEDDTLFLMLSDKLIQIPLSDIEPKPDDSTGDVKIKLL